MILAHFTVYLSSAVALNLFVRAAEQPKTMSRRHQRERDSLICRPHPKHPRVLLQVLFPASQNAFVLVVFATLLLGSSAKECMFLQVLVLRVPLACCFVSQNVLRKTVSSRFTSRQSHTGAKEAAKSPKSKSHNQDELHTGQ